VHLRALHRAWGGRTRPIRAARLTGEGEPRFFALDIGARSDFFAIALRAGFRMLSVYPRGRARDGGAEVGEGQPSQAGLRALRTARPWKIIRIEKFSHSGWGSSFISSGSMRAARSALLSRAVVQPPHMGSTK